MFEEYAPYNPEPNQIAESLMDEYSPVSYVTPYAVKNINGMVTYFKSEEAAVSHTYMAPYGTCWVSFDPKVVPN